MKYYSSKTTGTIHMVGDFPPPSNEYSTQCGLPLETMTEINEKSVVKRLKKNLKCIRCEQLLGQG